MMFLSLRQALAYGISKEQWEADKRSYDAARVGKMLRKKGVKLSPAMESKTLDIFERVVNSQGGSLFE